MKFRILAILLLFVQFSFSQVITESNQLLLDSLNKKLHKAKTDSDYINQSRAYYKLIRLYENMGFQEKSRELIKLGLDASEKSGNKKAVAAMKNLIASNLCDDNKNQEAIPVFYEIADLLFQHGDTVKAADQFVNIGMIYLDLGMPDSSLFYKLKALKIRDEINDSTELAGFYQRIGNVYSVMKDYDNWEKYIKIALKLSEKNPNYSSYYSDCAIYNEMGGIYEHKKDYKQAILWYKKLYTLGKDGQYIDAEIMATHNLCNIYTTTHEFETAKYYADENIRLAKISNIDHELRNAYQASGRLALRVKNYQLALEHLNRTLELSEKTQSIEQAGKTCEYLSQLYAAKGDFHEALNFHQKYSNLKDSLRSSTNQRLIKEMEARYQTEKKEQQIKLLAQEKELANQKAANNQLWIIVSVVVAILIITTLGLFIYINRIRNQKEKGELEQRLLISQMNPHFIFNILGTIQNFMYKNDGKKAAFYLSKFSTLTRSILKNSRENYITLEEELESLKSFVELSQMQQSFDFDLSVDSHLEQDNVLIPPMLIQPFVENAIKHGVNNVENGALKLSLQQKEQKLLCTVSDNGKGITTAKPNQGHESYAMKIFEERIKNFKSTSNKNIKYSVSQLEEQKKGTEVLLEIPFELEN